MMKLNLPTKQYQKEYHGCQFQYDFIYALEFITCYQIAASYLYINFGRFDITL